MAQRLDGESGLLRRLFGLVTAIVLIAGLLLPAAPARAGLTDCLETIAPIKEVSQGAADAAKAAGCSSAATSDPVLAAIILVLSALAVDGKFSTSADCKAMVDSTIGQLIAQALVSSGLTGALDKIVPGAGDTVSQIAQGTTAQTLDNIQVLSEYLTCGCAVAGEPGNAKAVASAYADSAKGCAQILGDVAGFAASAVSSLVPSGQCLGGCPTATTGQFCVWNFVCGLGSIQGCIASAGNLQCDTDPYISISCAPGLVEAGPGQGGDYCTCPEGQAAQNGQCAPCPSASSGWCSVNIDGKGYTAYTSFTKAEPALNRLSCVSTGSGGASNPVSCPTGMVASKSGPASCGCSVPACIDGSVQGNVCTCGGHAHPVVTAVLSGNLDYGFKNVCTCDGGYTRNGSSGPCVPIITCSNSAQQPDYDKGTCVDICPRGAAYQPVGAGIGNPASASKAATIGPQGAGGTYSDLPPGCVPCASGAQCGCPTGLKADGNGSCQNFCAPGYRYVEPGVAADTNNAKSTRQSGGGAAIASIPRCVACASGKTTADDPTKCMLVKLIVPDTRREPSRSTRPSEPLRKTAARPSAAKPTGGAIAKTATVTCGPRMRLNANRTGCVPVLNVGGAAGSTAHGVVAPGISPVRRR